MKDLKNLIAVSQSIETDLVAATVDANGTGVDLQGFESATILAAVGESNDTLSGSVKIELEVEESDDDSTYTDVADADLIGYVDGTNDGTFAVIDAATEDQRAYIAGYIGSKRYIRVVVNVTGTHTNGTPIGAFVIKSHSRQNPPA